MELEVNKSHKKIDLSHIKKPLIRFGAGALVSLCIFSGMYNPNAKADEYVEIPPQPVEITSLYETTPQETTIEENIDYAVKIPDEYVFNILFQIGKTEHDQVMVSDLQKIEYLNISVEENAAETIAKKCEELLKKTESSTGFEECGISEEDWNEKIKIIAKNAEEEEYNNFNPRHATVEELELILKNAFKKI